MNRLIPFLLLAALAGCGGQPNGDPRLGDRSIVSGVAVPGQALVEGREVEREAAASPQRTFLAYWREIQQGRYGDARDRFALGLRRGIGGPRLAETLRSNSGLYRTSRPRIIEIKRRSKGRVATVRFIALTAASVTEPAPASTLLRRVDGRWLIAYSSSLDEELRAAVAKSSQRTRDPNSQLLDERAQAAGQTASSLQSRVFEGERQR